MKMDKQTQNKLRRAVIGDSSANIIEELESTITQQAEKITELEAQLATQKKQWFDDIADRNGTIGKLQEQLSELKCDHWRLREIADEDL
jgi:flagellar biosynthesis chaperone FliJ